MKNKILEVKDLVKSYDKNEVLKGINLSVEKGDIITLIGSSGSGKSTLLKCIAHLTEMDSGKVLINDQDMDRNLKKRHHMIGMVFQQFNLFHHFNAIENIMKPLMTVEKVSQQKASELARELLEKVKLGDKALNYPSQLSGGEKQRLAIARALAMKPEIMLFDEPTSALDPELCVEVFQTIKDLVEEGMTMIIVTHAMDFALEISDRIAFMENGLIIENEKTETIFKENSSNRTKDFLKRISFV